MFCFRLRRFDFHYIVSLYASDYDSDYDSVASENQPFNAGAMGSNPVEALKIFFGLKFAELLKLRLQLRWSHLHPICIPTVQINFISCLIPVSKYIWLNLKDALRTTQTRNTRRMDFCLDSNLSSNFFGQSQYSLIEIIPRWKIEYVLQ